MSDDIYENNFYSDGEESIWHDKGTRGNGLSAEKVYVERMKPVEFITSPYSANVNGIEFKSKTNGIFRVEGGKVIEVGEVKGSYRIVQPIEYCQAFDKFVGKPVDTLFFLGANKADKFTITWKLPKIDIYGDIIKIWGLLTMGFDGKYGQHLYVVGNRIVCRNTQSIGINNAIKTQNEGFGSYGSNGALASVRHNEKDHLDKFGYWMKYIQSEAESTVEMMKNLYCKMEETPISSDEAYGLFAKVYPYPEDLSSFCPPELVDERQEKYDTKKNDANENRDLAMSLFEGAGIEIGKTVFGALNCITEQQTHHVDSRKNDGFESLLIGNRQKITSKAFSVMSEYVRIR